jgi:hypothetical protein
MPRRPTTRILVSIDVPIWSLGIVALVVITARP